MKLMLVNPMLSALCVGGEDNTLNVAFIASRSAACFARSVSPFALSLRCFAPALYAAAACTSARVRSPSFAVISCTHHRGTHKHFEFLTLKRFLALHLPNVLHKAPRHDNLIWGTS